MNQASSAHQHQLIPEARELPAIPIPERLLPFTEVKIRTGFGSSFLYQLMKENKFPKPVKIGAASRWRESQVQLWIRAQIEGSASGKNATVRA